MNMKTMSTCLLLTVLLLFAGVGLTASSQEEQEGTGEDNVTQTARVTRTIDYVVGLNFCYNRADIEFGDNGPESTLLYTYLALEIDLDVMDYLTVGVVAGYNSNKFDGPVDFINLPLSLRYGDEAFKSMVFGLRARSEFFSWNDFSVEARGEFLLFKKFENTMPIQLPSVEGTAAIKNSFTQTSVDLLFKYDGLSTMTLFAGPQLNLISGELEASETIESLEGSETVDFKQKSAIGLAAGVHFDLGNHFEVDIKAGLFSRTSLSATIFYVF